MEILILGGTRFFGKRLVTKLVEKGYKVTIATRGKTQDDFGNSVKRIQIDRNQLDMSDLAQSGACYDVVYDQTKRVEFHLERIRNDIEIGFENTAAKTCLIHAEEASDFLSWLGDQRMNEPINACSNGSIKWKQFFGLLEDAIGKRAKLVKHSATENVSPYSEASSRYMDNRKAIDAGFEFSSLMEWLPGLVKDLV